MTPRQWLWSAIIAAHLGVVLLAPNPNFYVTEAVSGFLEPYARTLGMDGGWQFFSPYPWHADFYEYDAIDKEGHATLHTFPELSSSHWFRSGYNRRVAMLRAVAADPRNLNDVLVPYLCESHPEAMRLRVRAVSIDFPTVDQVRQGHRLNDLTDPTRRKSGDKGDHVCRE